MNKTALLAVGLITSIVILGYNFLGDDVKSTQNKKAVKAENIQIKSQSVSSINEVKPVSLVSDNKSEETRDVGEERKKVRRAPPPPISATISREVAHSRPNAHGHEDHSDDDQQRNAAPSPTGANQ